MFSPWREHSVIQNLNLVRKERDMVNMLPSKKPFSFGSGRGGRKVFYRQKCCLLMQKVRYLADQMNCSDFTPNDGWFARWKQRFSVSFKVEHGEKKSAAVPASEQWLQQKLFGIIQSYAPENIFNANETGLFYKLVDSRGYVKIERSKSSVGKCRKFE